MSTNIQEIWKPWIILFGRQIREAERDTSLTYEILSIFATYSLSDKVGVLARYDKIFGPNLKGDEVAYIPFDPGAKPNFVLPGIDYKPHRSVSITPNIEYVSYGETDGSKPQSDLIARVTFYYEWK